MRWGQGWQTSKEFCRKKIWFHLWLLKCCKSKNLYDIMTYFYSININLCSMKYIFIISLFFFFFSWYQNMFLYNQNRFVFNEMFFYYITFFSWYQNMFLFNQNKFVFNEIFFFIILLFFSCYQDIFLLNQKNFVFNKKYFYHIHIFSFKKNIFYYVNFSFITFLVSISGLPFVFTKVRFLDSVRKLNSTTGV